MSAEEEDFIMVARGDIERIVQERDEARAWVRDLASGMYVNCVYCGHRYGPGETTPVTMADALKAHVEACPKHPMSALKSERDALRAAIEPTEANVEAYYDVGDQVSGSHERDIRAVLAAIAARAKQGLP